MLEVHGVTDELACWYCFSKAPDPSAALKRQPSATGATVLPQSWKKATAKMKLNLLKEFGRAVVGKTRHAAAVMQASEQA